MSLYDPDNPQHERWRKNHRLGVYSAPQPETQHGRVAAVANHIRGSLADKCKR